MNGTIPTRITVIYDNPLDASAAVTTPEAAALLSDVFERATGGVRIVFAEVLDSFQAANAPAHARSSLLFGSGVSAPAAQARINAAFQRGLQTRDAELDLSHVLG